MDHVRITGNEGLGSYLPDDLGSYNSMVTSYTPPKDAVSKNPKSAVGKYLQSPALHYTIGTKLTENMSKNLEDMGFGNVLVADKAVDFVPEMVRLRTATMNEKDWMSSLHSSYQAHRLNNAALTGAETNVDENIHFAPRLAQGKGFGDKAETTGML